MARQSKHLRLGVNIDHVATIRNARGGEHPDPVRAAHLALNAGADGITAHLREDRRHISDYDIERLNSEISCPLNLEMAATEEMLAIALTTRPQACCLVPERRQELTTEGGLDVQGAQLQLKDFVEKIQDAEISVSFFIDPDSKQIEAAERIGADIIELHTGSYCKAAIEGTRVSISNELNRIIQAAEYADQLGLEVHAGHGLTFDTVAPIAVLSQVVELNIGHFLVGEAIFSGLDSNIRRMRSLMDKARADASESQSA